MRRLAGFTLVELVMVIVVLSIIGTVSFHFIAQSSEGAIATGQRQQRAMAAEVISEQISRALRNALPGSIRVTPDGACVEFMPILGGSVYQSVPIAHAAGSFPALSMSGKSSLTGHIAVYPIASSNVYALNSPGVLSTQAATVPAGNGAVAVTFSSGTFQFLTNSPTRRFFVVDTPRAFCQQGSFLYRYTGYGYVSSVNNLESTLAGGSVSRGVVGAPLQANSTQFAYQPPTLQRNGVVTFSFTLRDPSSGETMAVTQEVQVRNVP